MSAVSQPRISQPRSSEPRSSERSVSKSSDRPYFDLPHPWIHNQTDPYAIASGAGWYVAPHGKVLGWIQQYDEYPPDSWQVVHLFGVWSHGVDDEVAASGFSRARAWAQRSRSSASTPVNSRHSPRESAQTPRRSDEPGRPPGQPPRQPPSRRRHSLLG